ncbi:MAG: helix-turn-helix domain-containing protein [Caldilinea sp.]|jgi:AraC-like DNA-binding protein
MPIPKQRRILQSRTGVYLEEIIGLQAWDGHPMLMAAAHRHNELELNMVAQGTAVYFFGGRRVTLPANSLMLFWAIAPHQLVDALPDTFMYWLTLPLSWFLHLNWPEPFRRAVLNSELIIDPTASPEDRQRFVQWQADLTRNQPEDREVMLLEVEARLKRLVARLDLTQKPLAPATSPHQASHVEKLAEFLAKHYLEPLKIPEIAAQVNLHPHYAMAVFQKTFGVTLLDYLNTLRVAHAQQLLVTTDQQILEIALESGFGSASQFYAHFNRLCGISPKAYRASLR